jgi:23S rRNA pseudouridine1911/1915/1917 synthase
MKINIDSQTHSERLDKFVELRLKDLGFKQATRNMIKNSISDGVTVNDEKLKPSYRLKQEDKVVIHEEFWEKFFEQQDFSKEIQPQETKLNILYEDKYLIVLIKPKGMVVHPGVGNTKDTLANYIKGYLQSKNDFDKNMDRAGIIHRLDKGVSGVIVVAKNKEVQEKMKQQFANREVIKIYLAKVEKFRTSELSKYSKRDINEVIANINDAKENYDNWFKAKGYIGRTKTDRYKMTFKLYKFGNSKSAESYILPIDKDKMLIKIVTGRMHQIRATLKYYGYFIKGDKLYKPGKENISSNHIMLKSIYLSFVHPITKERLSFINI